ncbi:unnamed protein product [Dracunculus medinensis]|uniref:Uncharacterized protein n=1 Tax=Dracunculus medinensis TaxID=318479 RepID=A0A0N4U5M0_DRAME|nr:unnamed protein product [Dracunculus medinensis]
MDYWINSSSLQKGLLERRKVVDDQTFLRTEESRPEAILIGIHCRLPNAKHKADKSGDEPLQLTRNAKIKHIFYRSTFEFRFRNFSEAAEISCQTCMNKELLFSCVPADRTPTKCQPFSELLFSCVPADRTPTKCQPKAALSSDILSILTIVLDEYKAIY